MPEFKCLSGPMKYLSGYKYQLPEDVTFALPDCFAPYSYKSAYLELSGCTLTLRAMYAGDGPSGPTMDCKAGMRPAMLHDAIFQLIRLGILPPEFKEIADKLFYSGLLKDGMGKIRAWYWYQGVKHFGKPATIRNRDILVAP